MQKLLISILSLLAIALTLHAQDSVDVRQPLSSDSAFRAQIEAGRLKDSTTLTRIQSLFVDAIRYKALSSVSGNREYLLSTISNLQRIISIEDSLHIPYPSYYAAACYQLGRFYLSAQNKKPAYHYFQLAHHYDPKNTDYLESLIMMNSESSDPKLNKQAIKDLQYLEKQHPYNPNYCYMLFDSYANAGKYKQAQQELRKYISLNGESLTTLQYEIAILAYSNHESDIVPRINQYIIDNPEDRSRAEMLMAQYYTQRNDFDKAFPLLYRNLDNVQNYSLDRLINPYISTYFERGDTASAYHLLDTLMTLHPADVDVMNYAISVYNVTKDTASMMCVLHNICTIDTANNQAYTTLYQIYASRNLNDSLLMLATRGHKLFDDDDWAYRHLVAVALDTANKTSVIELCHQIIPKAKTAELKGIAYMFLGDTYSNTDSLQLAFAAYDSCLHYTPDNSYALNNYAYILATSPDVTAEELARTEKMAARALKLDASSPAVVDTYAWILYLRDDAVSAKMYYERLIRMADEGKTEFDAVNCWHIYCVFSKLQMPEAEEYLQRAKDLYLAKPSTVKDQKLIEILSK